MRDNFTGEKLTIITIYD